VKLPQIDNSRAFDWGKTSQDYAAYRAGYPESFYELLAALGVGKPGQRILDLGTGTGVLARAFAKPRDIHSTPPDDNPCLREKKCIGQRLNDCVQLPVRRGVQLC